MPKKKMKKQFVTRDVADLKPHPRQAELFPDLPDYELQQLADDIDKNGLAHPIEILPDGTVVGGHQRLRALKLLGKETARCRILHHLVDADEHEIVQYLIKDNLLRRQLTQLEQARLYRELLKLERKEGGRNGDMKGDLRDHLAKQFGCSGRTLDRWVKVLDCPREVQDAFSRDELPLVTAGKVADLTKPVQRKIAKAIRDGGNPKEAVQEQLDAEGKGTLQSTDWLVTSFLRTLHRGVENLSSQKDFDLRFIKSSDLDVLKPAQKLIDRLFQESQK
jgi:ParB-like chromosome segregation protein Spo0J